MWEKVKGLLDASHIIAGLIGMLVIAGIAYGRSSATIDEHDKRIARIEAFQREDVRMLRDEMIARFNRLEDRLDKVK